MRAPLCPDSADINPDDQGLIVSDSECNTEIQAIERSLERRNSNKTAVFGICLDHLMGTSPHLEPQVPFVLSRLCRYIETHGLCSKTLFLESDEKNLVEALKVEFIESGDAPLEAAGNVTSAAKLLIIFFEELPEPLIPVIFHKSFVKDLNKFSPESLECIDYLKCNVSKLPDCASLILKYLSRFLLHVSSHEECNGMNPDSLAFIFGPLIFRVSVNHEMFSSTKTIVSCFVNDYHAIFEDESTEIYMKQNRDSIEPRRQRACLSSGIPILSPLSVIIPSVNPEDENNGNVRILIIERKMNNLPEKLCEKRIEEPAKNTSIIPTRKRKERRPSGEDTQVQRSSSEERPPSSSLEREFMRRCSSHEDMNTEHLGKLFAAKSQVQDGKSGSEKDHSPHPPNAKRREVELKKTENIVSKSNSPVKASPMNLDLESAYGLQQNSLTELDMDCSSAMHRSVSCPENKSDEGLSLSWSMLFESEDAEPIRSEQRMSWPLAKDCHEDALLSPSVQSLRESKFYEAPLSPSAYRNYLSYRNTHLDPSVPPSPPVEQEDFAKSLAEGNAVSNSIKQLTKKIHSLKKKVRKFDENFEAEFGYKPSHAEKATHPEAKKMMSDLHKARKELKALKEESHLEEAISVPSWKSHSNVLGDTTNNVVNGKPSIEESVGETMRSLADERILCRRPELVEDMTSEQVADEKLAIQKALLHFESIHGKPSEVGDRNRIRPLYERYRCIKRMLFRSTKETTELQPILEHETMDFTSPQHRTPVEIPSEEEERISTPDICSDDFKPSESCARFLTSKYDNSNFHELPLSELIFQLQKAKSEKRHLRKILREFEMEFQRINGRKVQKEEKAPMEAMYGEYKHVKARLKLLEALISKHDQHQLM